MGDNMPQVIVKIEGEEKTVRELSMFDMKKKKGAMIIVKKYAARVKKRARTLVPVSPSDRKKSHGSAGDLKSSIQTKYYYEGMGAMILPAKPKGSHRHLVEYGTKTRTTKKGANRGKAPAQPFMRPAKAAQETAYNAEMKRLFDEDKTV